MDGSTGKSSAGFDDFRVMGSPVAQRYFGNEEPPIGELLTDPIAALLRRSDGISLEDVCRCIAEAMARRRDRGGESRPVCGF
jgi:hypothetical protein